MSRYSNIDFYTQTLAIQTRLTQSTYASVTPASADVIPLLQQFYAYYQESLLHNYSNVGARNGLRSEIYNLLRMQCASINGLAQNNLTFILGSGFELNKPAHKHPVPSDGKIKLITPLDDGKAMISFEGIRYRDWYEIVVKDAHGYVQLKTTTQNIVMLQDLPVNVTLEVKVRGVNNSGEGSWSAPIFFLLPLPAGIHHDNIHPINTPPPSRPSQVLGLKKASER